MKKAKKQTTGDYQSRVIENVKNGWKYPCMIVTENKPAGKWGNVTNYYFYNADENYFDYIASIPSWAGETGKYYSERLKVTGGAYSNFPQIGIQQFMKLAK